ncbi:MAG TPA: flagellar hook capping FlgD N-terminal domain-containing protein [Terriglobales bacterium]|nr:flagellar hook capping FlgD N-terminal domain-containing protein [Terriglobales bacterium]
MTISPLSQTQATTSTGSTGTAGTDSSGVVGLSSTESIDTTFLNLLVTELKTQDPTSPMDPTAMVGQMVSLNQLDQLIGIRELLTPAQTSTTSGAAVPTNSTAQQIAYAALGGK